MSKMVKKGYQTPRRFLERLKRVLLKAGWSRRHV